LPGRPSSACSSSTLGRSTDLRTRGLSPGRVRIENLCLSTSRSSCSPTLPDGQAIAADIGSDNTCARRFAKRARQRFPLFEFSTGHGYEPTRGRDGCGRRASQGASYNTGCNFVARLPTLPAMSRVASAPPRSGFIELCLPFNAAPVARCDVARARQVQSWCRSISSTRSTIRRRSLVPPILMNALASVRPSRVAMKSFRFVSD
jgi:hypothetical protein